MSVQTLDAHDRSPDGDKPVPTSALAHIPGDNGWPWSAIRSSYSRTPRVSSSGGPNNMAGLSKPCLRAEQRFAARPDANEFVLLDSQKCSRPCSAGACCSGACFHAG